MGDAAVKFCRTSKLAALLLAIASLLALPLTGRAASPGEARGKALFERNCSVCHGVDGRANTPVSQLLTPPPRNFTDPVDMGRVTTDRMYRAIKEGRPGTAMAAWSTVLGEMEIGDVIDYIRGFGASAQLAPAKLSLEIGRRIYAKDCASCHGASGRADTEAAKVLKPAPSSLSDPIRLARLDDGRLYLAIFRGRPGTAMGGWREILDPAEIIDLMRYVRTLAAPLPAGMTPAELDVRVGEQIYATYCVDCHGERGNGETPLGSHLSPHPRDFTAKALMASAGDEQLANSISRGRPGTAMAPWEGILTGDDVRRVVAYIRQRFAAGAAAPRVQ